MDLSEGDDPIQQDAPSEHAPEPRVRRSPRLTVVTNSELQEFRSCPQKHHFAYRERLRPLVDAKPLAVGGIFHAGMRSGLVAGWAPGWKSRPGDQRLAQQVEAAQRDIDDLVGKWAAKIVEHVQDADYEQLATEADDTAAMVKWMLAHYFTMTRGDLDQLVLVEAEVAFKVPVRDKRGLVRHLFFAGVRDAVLYDPGYNQLVLDEHKTSGSAPRDVEKRVEMDPQTAGYTYALKEQLASSEMRTVDGDVVPRDAGVGRVLYNVLRKSRPKDPKVNQDGKVSVAQCDTTPEKYNEALLEQQSARSIPITEKQREFFDVLVAKGDRYFARVEWHRTDAELERWRSETYVDAARVREAERDPTRRTRNTGHCNMAWSLPCSYRSVCLDPDAPELRKQFRVSADPHAEVREAEVEAGIDHNPQTAGAAS